MAVAGKYGSELHCETCNVPERILSPFWPLADLSVLSARRLLSAVKRTFVTPMCGNDGGLNGSAQHSSLLAKMECEHEAATSHPLFCGFAV